MAKSVLASRMRFKHFIRIIFFDNNKEIIKINGFVKIKKKYVQSKNYRKNDDQTGIIGLK